MYIYRCQGEIREVDIPARLAYDDPAKTFKNKPVPDGADVMYRIELVLLERPGTLRFAFNRIGLIFITLGWTPVLVVVGVLAYCCFFRKRGQAEADDTAADKKKKKKKK